MKYINLSIIFINLFLNFGSINSMQEIRIKDTNIEALKGPLKQLHTDKDITQYPPNYFTNITRHMETVSNQLANQDLPDSLFEKYKSALRWHADKFIKQLINDKTESFDERLSLLQSYFPPNNPMLSYYFEWGKKAINRQKQKDIKTQELITAKAFKQKKHEYKIKLLQDIIDSHPKSEKIDLFEYTPEIFKSLNLDISIIKEKQLSPKQQINLTANEYIKNITPIIQLKNKLREKAITLINYIITDNEKWPTLEDKLTAIEECLATETEYFLKEALEYNESENLSTIIASEELANKKDEKQTSTNISQELPKIETPKIEEEKEKPEFRMPQHKPTLQISQLSSSVNDPFKQPQKYVKKTKKAQQPTGWIPYIWQGITNTINTVYYFFSWAIREVKDILGINND